MTKTEPSTDNEALLAAYRAYVEDSERRFREIGRLVDEVRRLLAEGPPSQRLGLRRR